MKTFSSFFHPENVQYRSVKCGSILDQIRAYNKRTDCVLSGKYTLCYPVPMGNTCGEFVQLCTLTDSLAVNDDCPYRLEDILKFKNSDRILVSSTFAGEPNIRDKVHLTDFVLEPFGGDTVTMKFLVNLPEILIKDEQLTEYRIKIPFTVVPMLQFVLDVEIGDIAQQKMAVSFLKGGEALIYELSTSYNTPSEGG